MDKVNTFYLVKVNSLSNNPDYISKIQKYIFEIDKNHVPVVFDYKHFSLLTNTSTTYLSSIVLRTHHLYRFFYIKKRSGGKRRISVPENGLINLQDWLLHNILEQIPCSQYCQAYIKGSSIKNNAELHLGKKYIIKLDLENFFESISERQVYKIFRKLGYLPNISFLFTRICTYPLDINKKYNSKRWATYNNHYYKDKILYNKKNKVGSLLQGAKTSPYLSNLCLAELDELIGTYCTSKNFTYTRYSDDIFISSNFTTHNECIEIMNYVIHTFQKHGFRINKKKSRILRPGNRKVVTGIIVNDSCPHVPKNTIHKIENYIYFAKKYGISSECKHLGFKSISGFKHHLYGTINYITTIEADKGKHLLNLANSLEWPKI